MKLLKNEKGSSLILILMIMMVIVILSTAVLQLTSTELLQVSIEEKSKRAYYLARAGAEAAVSAWLQEAASNKPEGALKRVYLNLDTDTFQLNKPTACGGYFDVTIEKIDEPGSERHGFTQITSTGTVDNYSRTVRIITYPFAYGLDLGWYNEAGKIGEYHNKEFDEEFVYLSLNQNKIFTCEDKAEYNGSFGAKQIVLGSPIKIDLGALNNQGYRYEPVYNKTFTVSAESIYFDNIEISYCPETRYSHWFYGSWTRTQRNGRLILKVPEELAGIPYTEVPGGTFNTKYGKVYFDGEKIVRQNYKWNASWILLLGFYDFRIEINGSPTQISYKGKTLAGNAYYFKDGTDLLNIKEGDLIPIIDNTERPKLKGIKPYYWE
ncbi:MAG: hypothetical protein AB2421_13830 [Thermotaleaceae bacterium]